MSMDSSLGGSQFLHEHFVVGHNTDLSGPDEDNGRVYNFKHDN